MSVCMECTGCQCVWSVWGDSVWGDSVESVWGDSV